MMGLYWIGGSPCAGKTTISEIIAQEFNWLVYSIDRYFETYLARATPDEHPFLTSYKTMGLKHFLLQPAESQLDQVTGISYEQFDFILADIQTLQETDPTRPILVEGSNILAKQVAKQLQTINQTIWLVPTEDFQLETYPTRGSWVQDVLRHHYEPDDGILAFERWMERDAQWAKQTASQAKTHNIPVITVDGSVPLLDNAESVMRHFGLLSDEA